jgi:nicotinamidase-related amidase
MAIWDDLITESDKEIYKKAGFRVASVGTKELGNNPALVIIDVTYGFVGDKPEPISQSTERFPLSCGERGWNAVEQIASLLPLAREKRLPIVYSVNDPSVPRKWVSRNPGSVKAWKTPVSNEIVREIAPSEGDILIRKFAPSIFMQTPLINILTPLKVDTLLICGGATSGCVRASVVDAASYGFTVGVIEECTFDRGEVSHKVNLFDMNSKYASVVSNAEIKEYLGKVVQ